MGKKPFAFMLAATVLVLIWPLSSITISVARPPHIIFFLADDLGWKDVGYHGSEIQTPNIDRMAAQGVRLEQFYAMPLCTPTRACLMTGRYPMRQGLQTGVIKPWDSYGLPLEERTLPQALKEVGYRTAIVGKWHLGHADPAYLPTRRGFDRQYGLYNGQTDYYTHQWLGALDWHRDDRALHEDGYSTHLIAREAVHIIETHNMAQPLFLYVAFNAPHIPLQAPEEYLRRYRHIADEKRRTYAAMVTCMDEAIGQILRALEQRAMATNTLVIFSSDNGGPVPPSMTANGSDNGSLRGGKRTLYEGGMRVPALVLWPGKLKPGVVNEPLHTVDWYPTLRNLAGASRKQPLALDGKDAWPTIAEGRPSPHTEILYNIESDGGAIRGGNWKLVVNGNRMPINGQVIADQGVELFNLATDPYEKTNLATQYPEKVKELRDRLDFYARQAVPAKDDLSLKPPAGFKAPAVWGERD